MKGKVVPINRHHGRRLKVIQAPERTSYQKESASPRLSSNSSPSANRKGTKNAPTPSPSSDRPEKKIPDLPVFRIRPSIAFPPPQAPKESPSMKTEMTTDRTGVMMPKDAKAV